MGVTVIRLESKPPSEQCVTKTLLDRLVLGGFISKMVGGFQGQKQIFPNVQVMQHSVYHRAPKKSLLVKHFE